MSQVFDFEVKMILQVLGNNETEARESLDQRGGLVTFREVNLLTITDIGDRHLSSVPDVTEVIAAKGGHNLPQTKTLERECLKCPVIVIAKNQEGLDRGHAEHMLRAHPIATPTSEGEGT